MYKILILMSVIFISNTSIAEDSNTKPPETFISKGACPGEGCFFGRWRATEDIDFVESIESEKVVGSIKKMSHVRALTGEVHGTSDVVEITNDFAEYKKGEKVYVLYDMGEGYYRVWHDGKTKEDDAIWCVLTDSTEDFCLDSNGEDWGLRIEEDEPTEWWVLFELKDGKKGWALGESFAGNMHTIIDDDDPEICWAMHKEDSRDNPCRKAGLPSPKESKEVCLGMVERRFLTKEDCR
ncbi:MAG: hypothetical protein ACE5J1_01125 [Nitrospiria bacterium]